MPILENNIYDKKTDVVLPCISINKILLTKLCVLKKLQLKKIIKSMKSNVKSTKSSFLRKTAI